MINSTTLTSLPGVFTYVNGLTSGWTFTYLLLFITFVSFLTIRRIIVGRDLDVLFGVVFLNTLLAGLLSIIGLVNTEALFIFIGSSIGCFLILLIKKL